MKPISKSIIYESVKTEFVFEINNEEYTIIETKTMDDNSIHPDYEYELKNSSGEEINIEDIGYSSYDDILEKIENNLG